MTSTETYSVQLGGLVPVNYSSPSQNIARQGMMLRVLVGSGVHGTAIAGQDDRDEMGVAVEPPASVIGRVKFEHYEYRTAVARTGREGTCSGPGDLDLIVYSLRKYAGLAAQGNPTVLLPLFVPDDLVCFVNGFGAELRAGRNLFLSQRAADRFRGYLHSQRQGLMGLRSGGTNNQGRADIRARYGFDVKFAMHMVRLGLQGCQLLREGVITLPMPGGELEYCQAIRRGEVSLQECLDTAEDLEQRIDQLKLTTSLPVEPDWEGINNWLVSVHRRYWEW